MDAGQRPNKPAAVHINFIPAEFDSDDIKALFSKAGTILTAKTFRPPGFSDPKFLFGFFKADLGIKSNAFELKNVRFSKEEEARRAIDMFDRTPPLNLAVKIDWKQNRDDQGGKDPAGLKSIKDGFARGRGRGRGRGEIPGDIGRGSSRSIQGRGPPLNVRGRDGLCGGDGGGSGSKYQDDQYGFCQQWHEEARGGVIDSPSQIDHSKMKGALLPTPSHPPINLTANSCGSSKPLTLDEDDYLLAPTGNLAMTERISITCSTDSQSNLRSVQLLPITPPLPTKGPAISLSDRFARMQSEDKFKGAESMVCPPRSSNVSGDSPIHSRAPSNKLALLPTPFASPNVNYTNHGTLDGFPSKGGKSLFDPRASGNNGKGFMATPLGSQPFANHAGSKNKSMVFRQTRSASDDQNGSGGVKHGTAQPTGESKIHAGNKARTPKSSSGQVKNKILHEPPKGNASKPVPPPLKAKQEQFSNPPKVSSPRASISHNKVEKVIMVHSVHPSLFYLQTIKHADEFLKIMKQLNDSDNFMTPPDKVEQGDMVCCKFAVDNSWYRAQVETVQDQNVLVKYIDYGNSATVDKKELRSLPSTDDLSFTAFPRQAIECALDCVEPHDGTSWSEDAICTFRRFCEIYKDNLFARLVRRTKDGRSMVVLSQGSEKGLSIAKVLCQKLLAQPPLLIRSSWIESWKRSQDFRLIVVAREKPNLVWVKHESLTSEEADDLFGGLNTACFDLDPGDESQIQINDLVAAKYTKDNNWYRATVVHRAGPGSWLVRYLDLGIAETTSVHPLSKHFWRLPSLAVLLKMDEQHADQLNLDATLYATILGRANDHAYTKLGIRLDQRSARGDAIHVTAISVWATCWSRLPPKPILDGKLIVHPIQLESLTSLHVQVRNDDTVKTLKKLAGLSEACTDSSSIDHLLLGPFVGQFVCAQFEEDDIWYRAVVLAVGSDGAATVRFVDYGKRQERTVGSRLRPVPPAFVTMPMVWCEVTPLTLRANVDVASMSELLLKHEEWVMTVVDGEQYVPTVMLSDASGVGLDQMFPG